VLAGHDLGLQVEEDEQRWAKNEAAAGAHQNPVSAGAEPQ